MCLGQAFLSFVGKNILLKCKFHLQHFLLVSFFSWCRLYTACMPLGKKKIQPNLLRCITSKTLVSCSNELSMVPVQPVEGQMRPLSAVSVSQEGAEEQILILILILISFWTSKAGEMNPIQWEFGMRRESDHFPPVQQTRPDKTHNIWASLSPAGQKQWGLLEEIEWKKMGAYGHEHTQEQCIKGRFFQSFIASLECESNWENPPECSAVQLTFEIIPS